MNASRRSLWAMAGVAALYAGVAPACGGDDAETSGGGSGGSSATDGGAGADGGGVGGSSAAGGSAGTAGATGGSAGSGAAAGVAGAGPECGDGVVEGAEECDDMNQTSGDGCQNTCVWTCETDGECDDTEPCNGVETCEIATHTCQPGTAPGAGDTCNASGDICVNGVCQAPSCGDAIPTGQEECDDGNSDVGDGCEPGCTFTCLASDPLRDCSNLNTDECAGTATCDDSTNTCLPGTALPDLVACNSGAGYCSGGVCTAPVCGNGNPEPGETCDDGDTDETNGCTTGCAFTCTSNAGCSDANVCTNDVCDTTAHTCSFPANAGQNGNACTVGGVTGVCSDGACAPVTCGNGTPNSGEECDRGALNGQAGSGCTANCQFSCDVNGDCSDGNVCNGNETCVNVSSGGNVVGKRCQNGTNANQGVQCQATPRRICSGTGTCVLSTCGDGFVDSGASEQCEPPNTPTCSGTCRTITGPVCGNGTIETGEQCDDSNTVNLDGCDSLCKYEVIHRLTDVDISGNQAPTYCTPRTNVLGTSIIGGLALGTLNTGLQNGITAGTTNILVQSLGLDDLTGVADPALELGVMSGALDPARGMWPGNNPIDWSFLVTPASVTMAGLPVSRLPGSVAARAMQAGPGDISLSLLLAGSPAVLRMRSAHVRGTVSTQTSVPAPPPAALAPGLQVFNTVTGTSSTQGLCGNITVESLAAIPVPQDLAVGGATACGTCGGGRTYTYCGMGNPVGPGCNSLLDVIVGGCRTFQVILCVTAINARATPDVSGSDGDSDTLTLGAGNKVPSAQTTGNDDAYSSYMTFTANRAHVTGVQ